jgi:hypothetical protein
MKNKLFNIPCSPCRRFLAICFSLAFPAILSSSYSTAPSLSDQHSALQGQD